MAREAIVEWLELRQEYKEYTRDRCKNGKEDVSAVLNNRKIKKAIQVNDAGRDLQKGDRSGRIDVEGQLDLLAVPLGVDEENEDGFG
ncbi:hypothetical protein F441_08651 [Phytophthora nicotianae CJ01A1]|uniref:Uncharacterized protein n=1 Tax=Phytophthora nicotianae CJ01A1 TaxID=1317063 RepID=W2X352_PHYNI|nr:hypothetical protein F441_08651 [Phytophthora nicotianae CJ01A1]